MIETQPLLFIKPWLLLQTNYQFAFKTSYKCLFSTVNWVRDWRANICAGVGKPQFRQNFHELILIRIWV